MPIPVWIPGQVLTASDINNWLVPNAVYKPSDQSVTSSTTLVNDTALILPLLASATYFFQVYLNYEGGTQGSSDIKWGWTVPAGTTMRYTAMYLSTAGAVTIAGTRIETDVVAAGSNGAATLRGLQMVGQVTVSTTAGNLQMQWAQNTISATSTIVHTGSTLSMQRTS